MSETALNPEEIPEFTGNLEQLEKDASALSLDGVSIADAASKVDSTFQGLSSYYAAPEAEKLFASTGPVAKGGSVFEDDLAKIGSALAAYATEIRPIVDRFKQLRAEAEAFRTSIADDDTWREDGDLVEENNNRRSAVNQAFADFQAAERTCHNKIVALVDGTPLKVTDGSESKNQYGFRAEDLDGAKDLPWGDPVVESTPWWQIHEHAWDFAKGVVVDGVWGTLKGLGTLVGFGGWDAMKQAWTGLAKLATGIVITASPFAAAFWLADDEQLPSWIRDSRTAMKETGKALVAWDQWGTNPARAAGATTFNVLTTVFTGGAGAGVSGAGKAGAISKAIAAAGKAGRVVDPMTYIFKAGVSSGVKIREVVAGLRMVTDGTYVRLADTTFELVDQPARFDDLPAGSGLTRENSVTMKDPESGEVFLWNLEDMTMHNLDGTPMPGTVLHEPSAAERLAEAAARQESPQLVSAGARTGEVTAQVGDELGETAGAADNLGLTGRLDENLPPTGRADDGAAGPRASHDGGGAGPERPFGGSGTDGPSPGSSTGHDSSGGNQGDASAGGPAAEDAVGGGRGTDDAATGGHTGNETPSTPSGSAGDPGGVDGTHELPGKGERYGEADRTSTPPTGPMRPDQEAAVSAALDRAKMPAQDQGRLLMRLSKESYGAGVAEHIGRGTFEGAFGYKELLNQCKQKGMIPAVHQALDFAADLHARGVKDIGFEYKAPREGLDLDVLVKAGDDIKYGVQLKDVDHAHGISSAGRGIVKKQLAGHIDGPKVAVLDIHDVKSALTEQTLKDVEHYAARTNATWELRFQDGAIIVPPGGQIYP